MQSHHRNLARKDTTGYNYRRTLPIFEKSGLLEPTKSSAQMKLKYSEPIDSMSPVTYFNNHDVEPRIRPILKAKLYRTGYMTPLSEFDLSAKGFFLIGRQNEGNTIHLHKNNPVDIGVPCGGCSKQHCVIQFKEINGQLVAYLIDLDSVNGTILNGVLIPSRRYVELSNNDIITFSTEETDSEFEIIYQVG